MTTLRARIQGGEILLAPGIFDGLSAHLAQEAGAEAIYLSGASIAYTRHGRPDIGLVSMSEVADTIALIADRTDLPLIVDADTGYGNALNVQRTVRTFEKMGAGAIQLEDQSLPKRCGHLAGKELVSKEEMAGKIKAALDARASEETLIMARTDAIAVEGFDAALDRAELYVEAGADILFVEAPASVDHMHAIIKRFGGRVPLLANMVEGGKTPLLSAKELQEIGYKLVIFPGGLVRMLVPAIRDYFSSLISDGTTAGLQNKMTDFAGVNSAIGTDDLIALGKTYDNKAASND